jgi:GxxExxY protein
MEVETTPLGREVIACAIEVHTNLGPGLLEPLYQRCMSIEMASRGLRFREQLALPVTYKGHDVGFGYRIDFVVEDELRLELKSVERVLPVHDAQVLTYQRLLRVRQAFLMNFNQRRLVDGLRSFLPVLSGPPPKVASRLHVFTV